jgi:HEAT repeat protein
MTKLLVSLALYSVPTMASIPNPSSPNAAHRDYRKETEAVLALRLPAENRMSALRALGPHIFDVLEQLNEDRSQTLQVRWRALTALGELNPQKALPILQKGLVSSDWFQRNASLLALQFGSRETALTAAARLLEDPSLIVRTSAVQVMTQFHDKEHEDLLWKKLYSAENFSHGQSLWIRKYIARALVQIATPKSLPKLQRMRDDEDAEIREIAEQRVSRTESLEGL